MEELKSCPFCGGDEAGTKWHHGYWSVQCSYYAEDSLPYRCNQDWGEFDTEEEAVAAWNTRPDNWISVEDILPTVDPRYGDIDVLVYVDDGFIATATYDKNNGWELWADSGEVTHWQPLPKPPK